MIEEYKTDRIKLDVSPATVNRELSFLRHLFNKAIEWGYLMKNPMQGVKLLKEPPGRIRYLRIEEIERLLDVIDSFPKDIRSYLKPIVLIALNTGLRKKEILQLRWKDTYFEKKKITVFITKTNEIRIVPMNETVYRELKEMSRNVDSEYLFCNKKGEPFGNVRKSFGRALNSAGINDFRFHDLRHTFASHLSRSHLQEAVESLDMSWTPYGHQKGFRGNSQKDKDDEKLSKIRT
jgi:integrase